MTEAKHAKEFSQKELMTVVAARALRDGERVLAGTGIPQVAATLAKYTHAPNLVILVENGYAGAQPVHPFVGTSDNRALYRSTIFTTFLDMNGMVLHRGKVDTGFLTGMEVDMYGNLNLTVIPSWEAATVRPSGGGGANDIASLSDRILVIMRHEKRKFTPRVAHLTCPGYIDGPRGREKAGLRGKGTEFVFSTLAVLGFDDETKRMKLVTLHPGVTLDEVKANTGFELIIPSRVPTTEPPTVEEQKLIREVIDTSGFYTAWKEPEIAWWGKE
jgi:acyl CoA:acetate/3-ketoacid CoA transferase beta subunit